MSTVHAERFSAPPVNEREILRYAGAKPDAADLTAFMHECLAQCEGKLRFDVCWTRFPLKIQGDEMDLGFAVTQSKSLALNLQKCEEIILFAATVGLEMDRLIARSRLSPVRHLMMQAIGAERVESLCDCFEEQLAQSLELRPRFSPGYGDLPLALQRQVFEALDCSRQIGISLNESLLMTPSKSVTAIIGVLGERSKS